MAVDSSEMSFEIPTIDLSPYIADPQSPAALKVIKDVRTACTTTGFFQITNHGISRTLQESVFLGAAAFFALPLEEKQKLDRNKPNTGPSNRGYEVMGAQALQKGAPADLKEGFYVSSDLPTSHPLAKAHPQFLGPNIFPSPSVLAYPLFKEPMEKYWDACFELCKTIMEILAAGLPYGPNIFDKFLSNEPLAIIRALYYPPMPPSPPPSETDLVSDDKEVILGAGAHTDFGAITLLLQDEHSGLEVQYQGAWTPVTPNKDAYVVNIGDMLDKWTKGLYKSSVHRVVRERGELKGRYSVPFFFDGNLECRLAPFDGSGGEEDVLTVEDHMRERFASTYKS